MKQVIYHGDNYNTTVLSADRMDSGNNQEGIGIYFADDKSVAESYGINVVALEIDRKDFLLSRGYIGDYVKQEILIKFFQECLKADDEFWYLLTEYGIDVIEPEDIEDYHLEILADYMKDEEVRNFQITISQQIGVDKFIKIWKNVIKKQGTFEKTQGWYAVIYSDNKLIKENKMDNFFESKVGAKEWLNENELSEADIFAKKFENIFYKVFPNSLINSKFSTRFYTSIHIDFTLGNGTKEYENGILQNDPMLTRITIDNQGKELPEDGNLIDITLMMESEGVRVDVVSEDPTYAFQGVKVPFRRVTGNQDKVLKAFDIMINRLYAVVKDNKDKIKVPFDINKKL